MRLSYQIKYLTIIIVMVLSLIGCHQPRPHAPPSFETLDGKLITPADYQHKWVVINYWAHWCKPCLEEIPQLNAFASAHADTVLVMGVNFDHLNKASLQPIIRNMQIQFITLAEDPTKALELEITGLPTTVILNHQGKIVKVLLGPQNKNSLEKAIESIGE